MKEKTLVTLIQKAIETFGEETTDNLLAGMLLLHRDYFKLRDALEDYLNNNTD